jgi:hypothetical protein
VLLHGLDRELERVTRLEKDVEQDDVVVIDHRNFDRHSGRAIERGCGGYEIMRLFYDAVGTILL